MKTRTTRLQRTGFVLLASVLTALGVYQIHDFFQTPAWPVYDRLQRATALETSSDVVLIYITQTSLDQAEKDIGYKFPWPREIWGQVLDVAKKLDAKSVTFDINFATSSMYGVADDESFNTSIQRNRIPVVMPGPDGGRMTAGPNERIAKELGPLLSLGATTVAQEQDGIYRRMPVDIRGHRPLAFARGEAPKDDVWMKFYRARAIPWVDVYSLFNLYTGLKSESLSKIEDTLRGKHWIVGGAAPGLLDLKPIPTNPKAPGPEIHATALSNMIDHQEVRFFSSRADAAAAFVGALLTFTILIFSATPIPALIGASVLSLLGPFVISVLVWTQGYWFNPLPTLTVTGCLALITLGTRFQFEWRERQRLAKTVQHSMSSEMADLIRRGKLQISRFGERREISIFFSDLSGFTTISENLDANVLVEVLNMYMQETVDLIFENRGFVDKFIGDAVMAFWGAPVDSENHAKEALEAAIGFQAAFSRFREKARAVIGDSANELSARVGVHTGTAIVGNIGAHFRYNYTAIGDPVNLASRLEGLGKQYHSDLLISEELLIAAGRGGDRAFIELDLIAVKGKSTATRIFTHDVSVEPDVRVTYAKALDFYRHARFAEALESFDAIGGRFGPAAKMGDRCRSALRDGSPKSYRKGVWYFDEK